MNAEGDNVAHAATNYGYIRAGRPLNDDETTFKC
jgi:hypothetical protein